MAKTRLKRTLPQAFKAFTKLKTHSTMKTTIRDIRDGLGVDITNYSAKQCYELLNKESEAGGYMQEIAWAPCLYGCGAKLYYGTGTHTFYKITRRTTALFCI